MKKIKSRIGLVGLIGLIGLMGIIGMLGVGCVGLDRTLYNVETNYVPHVVVRTNTVTVTNFVPVVVGTTNVVTVTNEIGVVTQQTNVVTITNLVEHRIIESQVSATTNLVPVTTLVDKPAAVDAIKTVGGIAGAYIPGAGGLITTALVGLLGIYRNARNKKTIGALIQGIETGREVLTNTPQGQELFTRYTKWLQSHQREAGVLSEVRRLVDTYADNEAAREAAKLLLPAPGTTSGSAAAVIRS